MVGGVLAAGGGWRAPEAAALFARMLRSWLLISLVTAAEQFGCQVARNPRNVHGPARSRTIQHRPARSRSIRLEDVISPFETVDCNSNRLTGPLPLTPENVEAVLDEMRPYLMADGGNVALREIDGATVVLELQGACGTCPSSSMTMTMGLEKGLRDKIPEIVSVEQVSAEGVPISEEAIEAVLGEVRPFLKMTGGNVELLSVDPDDLMVG